MPKDDEVRLRHMLDAGREALAFAAGKARGDLEANRMLVLALVKWTVATAWERLAT